MSLRVIIAGGRNYRLTMEDYQWLDTLPIGEVVCGCAEGADTDGASWALRRKLPVKKFPADWKKHGRAAGPIRNRQMAEYSDAVALFPGGRGTTNMRKVAEELGLMILEKP